MTRRKPSHSKYDDPKIQKTILDALRDGNYLTTAAKLAQIHPDTLWDWMRKVKEARQGLFEADPVLIDFVERMELAIAMWEADTVKVVQDVARSGKPNTWQAAMTMLERKAPDRWGRRDKVELEVDAEKPLIQVNQLILSNEEARTESRQMLRRFVELAGQHSEANTPAEIEAENDTAEGEESHDSV